MIEQTLRDNLLKLADAYCKATGKALSSVGTYAHGDAYIFRKLREGSCSITARKYDGAVAWFHANWPDGCAWPDLAVPDVSRPNQEKPNGKKSKSDK